MPSRRHNSVIDCSLRKPSRKMRILDPPPMKWSDSKYGYASEEDCNGEEAQA